MQTKQELEMNCDFSLALLLPETEVKRFCREFIKGARNVTSINKIRTADSLIEEITKKFDVSRDLVIGRLVKLNILKTNIFLL